MAVSGVRHELGLNALDDLRVKGSRTDRLPVPSDTAEGMPLIDPKEDRLADTLSLSPRLNEIQPPRNLKPAFFLRRGQDCGNLGGKRIACGSSRCWLRTDRGAAESNQQKPRRERD